MANILICYFAPVETIYKSLAETLADMGNNVYRLNIFGYIDCDKWGGSHKLKSVKTLDVLKDINFDFVIDFNHSIPKELLDRLTCPICLYDADNPDCWWNKDILKNNLDRYVFLGFKSCDKELYEREFGGEIKKYLHIPAGTIIKAEQLEKTHQISFIGSNFLNINKLIIDYNIFNSIETNFELFLFLYSQISKDYFITANQLYQEYHSQIDKTLFDKYFYLIHWYIYPGCQRLSYLSVLSDLNLTIYGNDIWLDMLPIYTELTTCFNTKRITTPQESQHIYNSSKIAVNISHPQAKDYFSWRVLDIMASSACLLTEDKKDFRDLFSPHISEEVMNYIIFKDRFDMREKAINLLNNEELRSKCVYECQQAVEKIGRWKSKMETLFEFLQIPLDNNKQGTDTLLLPILYPLENIPKKKKLSKSKRYQKLIFYSFVLFLSYIPLTSYLFKEKKRRKLIQKLTDIQNGSV